MSDPLENNLQAKLDALLAHLGVAPSQKVEEPLVCEKIITITTEVPVWCAEAIETERIAQKRPSRSNMVSVILQEWATKKASA